MAETQTHLAREPKIAPGTCTPVPQLAPGVELREFVSANCDARGLSSGTATFEPGAELAYHLHVFSEPVTVVSGEVEVLVKERSYHLSPLDGMHFPLGTAHSIVNRAADRKLVAHWACATANTARKLLSNGFDQAGKSSDVMPLQTPEYVIRFPESESYELAEDAVFTGLFGRRFGTAGIFGGYALFARARHCLATSIAMTSQSQSFGVRRPAK